MQSRPAALHLIMDSRIVESGIGSRVIGRILGSLGVGSGNYCGGEPKSAMQGSPDELRGMIRRRSVGRSSVGITLVGMIRRRSVG